MANIAKTKLGTSDDASLCNSGFALFPGVDSVNAGVHPKSTSTDFFNTDFSLLFFKISGAAGGEITFGICGPGYGFNVMAEGTTTGKQLALNLSDDKMEAGCFVGASMEGHLDLNVERLSFDFVWDGWNTGIKTHWEKLAGLQVKLELDFIGLIVELVELLMKERGSPSSTLKDVGKFAPKLLGGWGMVDGAAGTLGTTGQINVRPGFTLPLNIVPKVAVLEGFDAALKLICGGFSAGPSIGVQIPIRLNVENVKLSKGAQTATYPVSNFSGGTMNLTTTDNVPDAPDRISLGLQHFPGFDIQVGVFFNISALKIFSVGMTLTFNLLEMLNIQPEGGPFHNTVSNTVGKTSINSGFAGVNHLDEGSFVEFVLSPPALVTA